MTDDFRLDGDAPPDRPTPKRAPEQLPCDIGLFGIDAKQPDMVDWIQQQEVKDA